MTNAQQVLIIIIFCKYRPCSQAESHAESWSKFVSHYKQLLRRIQQRRGMHKLQAPFDFADVSEHMDLKKRTSPRSLQCCRLKNFCSCGGVLLLASCTFLHERIV